MLNSRFLLFQLILAFGFISKASAFPDMVKHGYFSCTACHFSPTGGGNLTPYGRVLSAELMSTWGNENDAEFLHGAVKTPEWLHMGGNIRALQLYIDNPAVEKAEIFPMQADLEAVAQFGKWTLAAVMGATKKRGVKNAPIQSLSRKYYVMYQATEEVSVRTGRFFPAYGLLTPDHSRVTRRGLGFDQAQETFNLEVAYLKPEFEVIATGIGRRFNENQNIPEQGGALSLGFGIGKKSKLGIGVLRTHQLAQRRDLAGLWGVLTFPAKIYLMKDWSIQELKQKLSDTKTQSLLLYNEIGYDWKKGFTPYLIYERSQDLQRSMSDLSFEIFGGGMHFLPYPHFEFKLEYQNKTDKEPLTTSHTAWLMMHYYL